MKRVLMAVAALSTLAAASTAAAQPYRGGGYDRGYGGGYDQDYGQRNQGQRLEARIQRAAQNGSISWREARSLQFQVDQVQRLEWRYRQNGMSGWEVRDLERRYDDIRQRIRWERSDGDRAPGSRYGSGYGNGGWR